MPKVSTAKSAFVNPASLSFHSTPDNMSSASPEPESQPGPSRKRPRSEVSSEERKEARAHRNRIAAQNSRDRRKAQFSLLERRVAELEEENRQLRAGMGISSASSPVSILSPSISTKPTSDEARDRENEELRERIRTLEKGWDAVVKALAAQGLPTGLPPSSSHTESAPTSISVSPPTTIPTASLSSSSSTFSVSVSPSISTSVTLSSPAPSESPEANQSTRHLARVATTGGTPPPLSLQRVDWPSMTPTVTVLDDATMESLFHEIISERESSPPPHAYSGLSSLLTAERHSTPGLPQSQDSLVQALAANTAAASEEEMTGVVLEEDRGMNVNGENSGGLIGLGMVGMSGTTGSMETDGLSFGLTYDQLESDMTELGNFIGESVPSPESSAAWSNIGLTLEAFLDILPGAQDLTDSAPISNVFEALEGRVGLV
ncbi:hypothetical protein D9757_006111 [Collybiopsis confluens]|uniref:X-box-binding protein 1 n=1 Tax=Collybiopsis confluens TaxID=2823264 RepID=A0A8H5HHI7_9AGAR|nr:hypothetical protein D9757_006111 [Collybiopsis confluens]